ncbi:hypothetical protein I8748_33875 [Nostoc sp. CENA67]|uniref:Uncharacterized protein n=1 Tax=Amazonocrinis nigriterrae CENA67 TaxID=2794033 RepID=A0A8J7HXX0_9NOST|nr:hypothetical protein [Amazonocrinis nigriterrae]MBH8567082.1 hypothetical protein [Amazonocrinis nigriterrae CENA67]
MQNITLTGLTQLAQIFSALAVNNQESRGASAVGGFPDSRATGVQKTLIFGLLTLDLVQLTPKKYDTCVSPNRISLKFKNYELPLRFRQLLHLGSHPCGWVSRQPLGVA